jgi:hypothetical protein
MKPSICLLAFLASTATVNAQMNIPDGTRVHVRLVQVISSATIEQGQEVQFEVAEAIKINNVPLIPEGSVVTGTITEAHEKRRMGRAGKLDFSIDRVRAVDGEWIPLRYTLQKKSGSSHAVRSGILTAGIAAVFWPAAPVMLLMKGKDVTINKGVTFDVFTDTAHEIVAASAAPSRTSENPTAAGATVSIRSPFEGADIEIDGAFVGSTPTTVQLTPGSHQIVVKRDSRTWSRMLQITPGNTITLVAFPDSTATSVADNR